MYGLNVCMCRCYSDGAVLLHISHEVVVSDQVISSTTTTSIAPWISAVVVAVAVIVAVVVVHHAGKLRRGEAVAVAQLLHLHMDNGSTCSLSDPLHYSTTHLVGLHHDSVRHGLLHCAAVLQAEVVGVDQPRRRGERGQRDLAAVVRQEIYRDSGIQVKDCTVTCANCNHLRLSLSL